MKRLFIAALLCLRLWAQESPEILLPETAPLPTMPNLGGQILEQAREQCPRPPKLVYLSSGGRPNRVLYQVPGAGAEVAEGQDITLYISRPAPARALPHRPVAAQRPRLSPVWVISLLAQGGLMLLWILALLGFHRERANPSQASFETLHQRRP